jgi:hypothetical protein
MDEKKSAGERTYSHQRLPRNENGNGGKCADVLMKDHLLFFAFALALLLSSCSFARNIDIQKRHYRNGFYIHLKKDEMYVRDSFEKIFQPRLINFHNPGSKKLFRDNKVIESKADPKRIIKAPDKIGS